MCAFPLFAVCQEQYMLQVLQQHYAFTLTLKSSFVKCISQSLNTGVISLLLYGIKEFITQITKCDKTSGVYSVITLCPFTMQVCGDNATLHVL